MIVRKKYLAGGLLGTGAKAVYKANKDSIKSFVTVSYTHLTLPTMVQV